MKENFDLVLDYFRDEYRYSEDDLIQMFGDEYFELLNYLVSMEMNEPADDHARQYMTRAIDNFMIDNVQTKRKKRSY